MVCGALNEGQTMTPHKMQAMRDKVIKNMIATVADDPAFDLNNGPYKLIPGIAQSQATGKRIQIEVPGDRPEDIGLFLDANLPRPFLLTRTMTGLEASSAPDYEDLGWTVFVDYPKLA